MRPIPSAVAVVVLLLGAAAGEACDLPAGGATGRRVDEAGITVVYRTRPSPVEVGRHFTLEAVVCGGDRPSILTRVDAHMPEHRHGMNYRASLEAQGGGRYLADGFLFHMPGRWQLVFDVERDGRRTRLVTDLSVE